MGAFSCFITLGVLVHLISCDVSHTIDSNRPNVKSAQPVRSNYYQPQSQPQGYDYSGSYSTVSPENKAQYVAQGSSKTSYDQYPSGQVSSEQRFVSAKQEYNPQYQNDRGVLLISKELQVPYVSSKGHDESDCEGTHVSNVNQQVQNSETYKPVVNNGNQQVQNSETYKPDAVSNGNQQVQNRETYKPDVASNGNQQVQHSETYQPDVQNDEAFTSFVQSDETSKPVIKTSNYEVRRPGIRKEFYDIEEKVFIRPAGSAVFELQHDKPESAAIINRHIYQQQSQPSQFSDYEPQYYPQQYANHGYYPVITQSPSVPTNGYDYNYNPVVVQSPPRPQYSPYPNTHNYNPGYPSTAVPPQYVPPQYVPPQYVPPVTAGYLPPCDDTPSTPQPPSHEFSDEHEDDHDYDSDAAFINPQKEDNKEYVDVVYSPSKSNSNRNREDYRSPQSSVYNGPEYKIDRVRHEYQNQRGDLAQQKASQYSQQFNQEYVPNGNVNVNQKKVEVRPNGAPLAKYSQDKGLSQVEIANSQRLLDLYSANGDVTEIGSNGNAQSQQYQTPNNYQTNNNYQTPNNYARARVVSVTPAPKYADYVDEQTKSRRVVLSKPLYTVQKVEVHEHSHRLVEDIPSDSVEPKVSEFEKLKIIGTSSGKTSSVGQAEVNKKVEYVTPVPQEYAHLRAGSPVPDNLQK